VLLVILFPWVFTIFMSLHDWKVTGDIPFVGLANYAKMLRDGRFLWAIIRTIWFTAGTTIAPMVLGVWAAVCFGLGIQAAAGWPARCSCCDDGDAGGNCAGLDR